MDFLNYKRSHSRRNRNRFVGGCEQVVKRENSSLCHDWKENPIVRIAPNTYVNVIPIYKHTNDWMDFGNCSTKIILKFHPFLKSNKA